MAGKLCLGRFVSRMLSLSGGQGCAPQDHDNQI